MKKIYFLMLLSIACLLSFRGMAQERESFRGMAKKDTVRDKEYANPAVEGMERGRFIVLRYERLFDYRFNSTNQTPSLPPGGADARIKTNNLPEIKTYIPVWNKPHFKMVLGVGYEREEFNFKNPETVKDYPYHQNLQDKGLKALKAQLAFLHPLDPRKYITWRVKAELDGDYTSSELNFNDYLKTTGEFFYGWKKSKDYSIAIGLQLGYTFGRKTIYPAIIYNRTFNNHWGVESVFPANARMRYKASEKTYFYGGYNLNGYAYNIKVDDPQLAQQFPQIKTVELRHNDAFLLLRWNQEIYDFLWFGLEGGYRINASFDAFESGSKRKNKLIATDAGGAPYARAEIYFVVPRAFLKR